MPYKKRKTPSSKTRFTYTVYCPIWVRQVIASCCELKTKQKMPYKKRKPPSSRKNPHLRSNDRFGLKRFVAIFSYYKRAKELHILEYIYFSI